MAAAKIPAFVSSGPKVEGYIVRVTDQLLSILLSFRAGFRSVGHTEAPEVPGFGGSPDCSNDRGRLAETLPTDTCYPDLKIGLSN